MSQRSFSKRFAIMPPIRQPAVSDGFNLLNRSRPYPNHDQTFARGSAKAADLGLAFSLQGSGRTSETNPPAEGSSRAPKSVHSPDNDSKERADDIKALTISEVNC